MQLGVGTSDKNKLNAHLENKLTNDDDDDDDDDWWWW